MRPASVAAAQLPALAHAQTVEERIASERASSYDVVRVSIPTIQTGGTRTFDSGLIAFNGDTVKVLEIIGATHVGISLGKGRKFIPVQEGDEIRRPFTQLKVRQWTQVRPGGVPVAWRQYIPEVIVVLLVSVGPALVKVPYRDGFNEDFPTWKGTATTTGVRITTGLTANPNFDNSLGVPTPGKNGGMIQIQNTGANNLYIYTGDAGTFDPTAAADPSPNTSWMIRPGETWTLPLRQRATRLCAATAAGTVTFQVAASSWGDFSDQVNSGSSFFRDYA